MRTDPTPIFRGFVATLALHLAACGASGPPPEPCILPIAVVLEGGERLNPDDAGASLPTEVRLLQLTSLAKLEDAEFEALTSDATAALADTLLVSQDFTLYPGTPARAEIELDKDARFLVAVAMVRRPTGTMWRSVVVLPSSSDRCGDYLAAGAPDPAVRFRIEDYRVSGTTYLGDGEGARVLPQDVVH